MKVLIVNEDMDLGGAQRMAVVLANSLAKKPALKLAFAAAGGPLRTELDPRVPFHEITSFQSGNKVRLLKELRRVISEFGPDIIHSHGATVGVLSGFARTTARSTAALILTHHSRMPRRLPRFVANQMFRSCFDHLVAISRHKHADLINGGLPEEMISLIPNFVAAAPSHDQAEVRGALGISAEAAVVTMTGRLIKSKRFDRFIRILELASHRAKRPITGLIIGDGPEMSMLKALAKNGCAAMDLRFMGYQDDVARFLSVTDALVFPSEHPEVLPMALIEASAAGVPIVCSDIPGNREVVEDGLNGFLVAGDDEAYCDRLVALLEDASLAERMSESARRLAMVRFSEAKVVSDLVSMYERLISPN